MQAVTLTAAYPTVVNQAGHGKRNGELLRFFGSPAPNFIQVSTGYYVRWASVDTYKLSTTNAADQVQIAIATPGVVYWPAHGLNANDQLFFGTNGALPTGLTASNNGAAVPTYYFAKTIIDVDHFTLSATSGGAGIATSGTQSGNHFANKHVAVGCLSAGTSVTCEAYDPCLAISSGPTLLMADGHIKISNVPLAVTLNLVGMVAGSRWRVKRASDGFQAGMGVAGSTGAAAVIYSYGETPVALALSVRKSTAAPFYQSVDLTFTLPPQGTTVLINQLVDS